MVFSSAWQMPKERVRISGVCWEKGLAVIFHLKWHKCRCKQIIQESCRFFSIPSSNIHPKCLAFFGHRIQESLGRERERHSVNLYFAIEGIIWWNLMVEVFDASPKISIFRHFAKSLKREEILKWSWTLRYSSLLWHFLRHTPFWRHIWPEGETIRQFQRILPVELAFHASTIRTIILCTNSHLPGKEIFVLSPRCILYNIQYYSGMVNNCCNIYFSLYIRKRSKNCALGEDGNELENDAEPV